MHEKTEKCDCTHNFSSANVSVAQGELMTELSEFFKLFADTTRIRILTLLDRAELCVCEISAALAMTESAVSHQLKLLRQSNLVKSERRGKHIYYSLADSHVSDIIERALDHISE
jgi:ArsR family transcriptional regulator